MTSARDSLHRAITTVAASEVQATRVHVVAEVVSYDDATRTIVARPVQQVVRPSGEVVRLPDVHGVRLAAMHCGGFVVAAPASRGDVVLLEVPDQSIERWLADGVVSDADAARPGRELAHAIAVPAGRRASSTWSTGGHLVIGRESGGVQLVVTSTGKVSLGTSGVDLIDVLFDALFALATTTVTTPDGTFPLSSAATLGSLAGSIATLRRST